MYVVGLFSLRRRPSGPISRYGSPELTGNGDDLAAGVQQPQLAAELDDPHRDPLGQLGATEVTAPEELSAAGESPTCAAAGSATSSTNPAAPRAIAMQLRSHVSRESVTSEGLTARQ